MVKVLGLKNTAVVKKQDPNYLIELSLEAKMSDLPISQNLTSDRLAAPKAARMFYI